MPSKQIRERVVTVAQDFGLEKLPDEPTSNLDYRAIRDLHDMIAKKKAEGTTIVIAEHRLAWIADVADRFCFFESGVLAGQWMSADFKALPVGKLQQNRGFADYSSTTWLV